MECGAEDKLGRGGFCASRGREGCGGAWDVPMRAGHSQVDEKELPCGGPALPRATRNNGPRRGVQQQVVLGSCLCSVLRSCPDV